VLVLVLLSAFVALQVLLVVVVMLGPVSMKLYARVDV
jgi:hypothetical protein